MPDLDIVERSIPKRWRRTYRLIKGGHPVEEVADALVTAVAAQLRDDGGVPGLPETVAAAGARRSVHAVTREIEQRFQQQRSVKILGRANRRLDARVRAGRALPGALPLAEEHCRELARCNLFGRVEPTLIGEGRRFANPEELDDFEREVSSRVDGRFEQLARKILANPLSEKIRAPKRPRKKRSTAELLEEPISGVLSQ